MRGLGTRVAGVSGTPGSHGPRAKCGVRGSGGGRAARKKVFGRPARVRVTRRVEWRRPRRFGCFPQPGRPATESSFFHTPLWLRQVTSPLSLFSHLQSRDRNRAQVRELRGCSEVMWLPRLAQRLLCYGIFIIFLRLLPTSFLLPPFFALFQHTLPELSFLPNG